MSNGAGDDEGCHLFLLVELTFHWKRLRLPGFYFFQ